MSSQPKTIEEKLDPRVQRTRNQIVQAFSVLTTEKRFESISIQEVAARAQINRVTFYSHFQDKYDLLDHAIAEQFRAEVKRRILDACQYTPENLRSLIATVCELRVAGQDHCAQPHQQFESLVEGTMKKELFELLTHWLKQAKPSVPTEVPATVATWAIYGLATYYSHLKKRPHLETFVEQACPLVAINLEQFNPQSVR